MFSVCLASRTKARAGNSIAWFAVPVAKAIAPPQKTPNISVRTGRVDLSVCRRVPYVRHQNAPKELAHRFVEVTQHALARQFSGRLHVWQLWLGCETRQETARVPKSLPLRSKYRRRHSTGKNVTLLPSLREKNSIAYKYAQSTFSSRSAAVASPRLSKSWNLLSTGTNSRSRSASSALASL